MEVLKEYIMGSKNNGFIFPNEKNYPCSKIVFINLDGYESEFNINLAQYLWKNLMYVSFPKESASRSCESENDEGEGLAKFEYLSLIHI